MATPNYNIAPGESITEADFKRKLAYKLLMEGGSGAPVQHWTQGANRLVSALMGGMDLDRLQKADEKEKAQARDLYTSLLGGQSPGSPGATPASGGPPSAPSGGPSAFDPADIEMQAGLKTPVAYQPEVLESAKASNVNPMMLANLLKQESGFNPNAVGPPTRSGERAMGIAQFMPSTAGPRGVNPMDPTSAIPGAAKYIAELQGKFGGSEPMAAAAYNWGPGNVSKWQQAGGDPYKMPAETRNYVANVAPGNVPAPASVPPQAPGGPNPQLIAALMGNRLTAPLGQQIAGQIISKRLAPDSWQKLNDTTLYDPRDPNRRITVPENKTHVMGPDQRLVGPAGQTIAEPTKPVTTPGQKKLDEDFAKTYEDWTASGGVADVEKQLEQLREASRALKAPGNELTGPIVGMLPDAATAALNPKVVATREAVEEVAQRNLRLVLGAQFTEKEGERLIKRTYNPSLPPAENAKRVDRLIEQISKAAQSKQAAAEYFQKNGTLTGWKGRLPTLADFDFKDEPSPTAAGGQIKEGQTATNQQTKQRVIYRGGKWEPL